MLCLKNYSKYLFLNPRTPLITTYLFTVFNETVVTIIFVIFVWWSEIVLNYILRTDSVTNHTSGRKRKFTRNVSLFTLKKKNNNIYVLSFKISPFQHYSFFVFECVLSVRTHANTC